MEPDEAAAIRAVANRLRRRFPERSAEEIDRAVEEAQRLYEDRPIRHFVPIFVERDVMARLAPGAEPLVDPPELRAARHAPPS